MDSFKADHLQAPTEQCVPVRMLIFTPTTCTLLCRQHYRSSYIIETNHLAYINLIRWPPAKDPQLCSKNLRSISTLSRLKREKSSNLGRSLFESWRMGHIQVLISHPLMLSYNFFHPFLSRLSFSQTIASEPLSSSSHLTLPALLRIGTRCTMKPSS